MGIQNRDYIRDSGAPYRGRGGEQSGWKWLIGITVGVFMLQYMTAQGRGPSLVESWFELHPSLVLKGQVWRLLTYAFCHARENIFHIFFNMLWIFFFGRTLEAIYGTREFVLFYLTAAVFAGLVYCGFGLAMGDVAPVIGASGAVLATVMLMTLHFPRQQLLIFGIIPIEMRWMVLLIIILDALPVLQQLGGARLRDGVAHTAHLGGLAFGYLYYARQWKLSSLFGGNLSRAFRTRLRRKPSHVRVFEPPVEDDEPKAGLEAQVDAILEKIHEKGEASLTDHEREILKKASNRYKNRR